VKRKLFRLFLVLAFAAIIPVTISTVFFSKQIEDWSSIQNVEPPNTGEFLFDKKERFISFEETDLFLTNPNMIQKVRKAAVKVSRPNGSGHGSGTYMRVDKSFFVLTAAHVVDGLQSAIIHGRDGEIVIGKIVLRNKDSDYAVISIPEIRTRTSIKWRPRDEEVGLNAGTPVCYTGFPQNYDLLTITGELAGIVSKGDEDRLILHSYAWMGASGSGVFDMQGRLVGILVAAGVGEWYYPQIIEDIVWVVPAYLIDETFLKLRLELDRLEGSTRLKQMPGAATPRRGGRRD